MDKLKKTTDKLIDDMNTPRTDIEPPVFDVSQFTDRRGRSFDPALHEVDEQGLPRLTKRNKLRILGGRGRKATPTPQETSTIGTPGAGPSGIGLPGGPGAAPVADDIKYQATGASTAQAVFMLGVVLGGEDWKPKPEENQMMSGAFADYYRAKGIKDIPPGVLVVIALTSYAGPRLFMPKTKTRLAAAATWVKRKFKRGTPTDATQSNSGNDGKRQDDVSN
jgi:hypothetical protein